MADIREDQMNIVSSVDYLRGMSGKNSVLIDPVNLSHPYTGSGIVNAPFSNGKWYRIAIGNYGNIPSSALVNVAYMFNNSVPSGKLLYVFADAYSNGQVVSQLATGGINNDIGKVRILYADLHKRVFLDIYVKSYGSNDYYICCSNNIGFNFQYPEEVSDAVPEGYAIKEFSF